MSFPIRRRRCLRAQNATFSGTLTAVAGYASPVNLSCTGAKPTTCLLSTPQNPTPQATAQQTPTPSGATYTVTAGGVVGDYSFNAHAVGTDPQAIEHDAAVTLHIVAGPAADFTPAVTAVPNATVVGQNMTWNGTLTALNGYNTSVNLSCTGTAPGLHVRSLVVGADREPQRALYGDGGKRNRCDVQLQHPGHGRDADARASGEPDGRHRRYVDRYRKQCGDGRGGTECDLQLFGGSRRRSDVQRDGDSCVCESARAHWLQF